jgi:hypothetical protein
MRSKRTSVESERMTTDQAAKRAAQTGDVELPQPSQDQLDYLGRVKLQAEPFDATIVVGGPSHLRKPSA